MNKNREKKLWAVALVSLLVWMTAAVQGRIPAQRAQLFVGAQDTKRIQEEEAPGKGLYQLAWWGSLYPRTCLESAMRLVEEPDEEIQPIRPEEEKESRQEPGEDLPVRIRWKCLDLF